MYLLRVYPYIYLAFTTPPPDYVARTFRAVNHCTFQTLVWMTASMSFINIEFFTFKSRCVGFMRSQDRIRTYNEQPSSTDGIDTVIYLHS